MEEPDPLTGHPTLETIRTLGKSGTSTVVLARNRTNEQLVAVKLYRRGFDAQTKKYLLRELLNHYELTLAKHPHVVSLLDCFLTPRHLAVVLEYVDGENLQVFLEKAGGCVVESLARFLFQQLVIALDFCHRRAKVNRNIRPSGLLLQLGSSALPLLKLTDFSVSKDTLRHSQPRSQVGTAMYCAPEVLCNFRGAAYDAAAADVWSVGVVLYSMLYGRHPYARPEDAALPAAQQVIAMFKRVTAPAGTADGELYLPPVLPTSILPGAPAGAPLSPAAASLLSGLLARDPRDRLTLRAVQAHEWFRSSLPEGAAMLNDVVAAEEAAAGPAAVLSPAAAAQMERMVAAAAAGPAPPLGPGPVMEPAGASHDRRVGEGFPSPQHQRQHLQQNLPLWQQAPEAARTVTTFRASSEGRTSASPSVPAGSTPSSQPVSARAPRGPGGLGLAGGSSGDVTPTAASTAVAAEAARCAAATAMSVPASAAAAAAAAAGAETAAAVGALWSAFSGESGNAVDVHSDDDDGLMMELEELVKGVPEDDLMQAASLDFMLSASLLQQQQQQQQQQQPALPQLQQQQLQQPLRGVDVQQLQVQQPRPQTQQPHKQLLPHKQLQAHKQLPQAAQPQVSGSTSGVPVRHPAGGGACGLLSDDNSAPISTDTTGAGGLAPWPHVQLQTQPLAGWQPFELRPVLLPQPHGRAPAPGGHPSTPHLHYLEANGSGGNGNGNSRCGSGGNPNLPTTPAAPPHVAHLSPSNAPLGRANGQGHAAGTQAAAPPPPPLFASLQSIASGAGAAAAANGADYAASLLARLRTDSLPSPHTLAVVDPRPFLANDSDSSGHLNPMPTVPSSYSIDWCTLSARSETLLAPQMLGAASGGGRGPGAGGGVEGGGSGGGAGDPPPLLLQGSAWHRICHEARGALTGAQRAQ